MSFAKLKTVDGKLYVATPTTDDQGNETEKLQEVVKGWESFSGWYWFGIEVDHEQDSIIDGKEYPNDKIWFGLVQGFEDELGYFSETELRLLLPTLKVWKIAEHDLPLAGRR